MRNTPDRVMLFAAGFGTRMRHLVLDRPKPLIEVGRQTLLDRSLDLVGEIDASTTVVNAHYKAQMIVDHLAGRDVRTVIEAPDILDTGGGLKNALPLLGDAPVMTLNTDAVWSGPNPLSLLRNAWKPDDMDGLLMCVPIVRAMSHLGQGDFTPSRSGHITRGPGVVYGGAQIIKTDMLAEITDISFSLNVLWDKMIAKNRLSMVEYPGKWCDVGHPDGIVDAERLLRDGDV